VPHRDSEKCRTATDALGIHGVSNRTTLFFLSRERCRVVGDQAWKVLRDRLAATPRWGDGSQLGRVQSRMRSAGGWFSFGLGGPGELLIHRKQQSIEYRESGLTSMKVGSASTRSFAWSTRGATVIDRRYCTSTTRLRQCGRLSSDDR
jgi:hypothetical protein